ncbi:MAG: LL-diaminopimelate aminotransferase [Treponema sp.]|nr:LL-diaminopimelate aminotransferase [Treponema sp.]
MIQRNPGFANLTASYLFPEVARRKNEYSKAHPDAKVISLGVGNTTEPLTPHIAKAMSDYALALGTAQGYSGYGDDFGSADLREKIAKEFYPNENITADEVFISDGAKCDIARVQTLFGHEVNLAVQDPSYPVYVDGSVITGAAGTNDGSGYKGIVYMPCTAENNFFPDLSQVKKNSLIYFCSPNNPTGKVSTKEELSRLVEFALKNECIIIFDAAYSEFITDPNLPKSIFQIEGAKRCAIEVQSLSKPAGFTGVRLGWSVVPNDLKFADGTSINKDWQRLMTTLFNGASNIAQQGALAALDETGRKEMRSVIEYYLENARIIEKTVRKWENAEVFFTGNSPYLWVRFTGQKSWDIFDKILDKCRVVTTPGSGFGPAGESFIRISAFGHRADVEEACRRLENFSL